MSKSITDLKSIVEHEIEKCISEIECFEGNANPQVKEMYIQVIAKKEVLEAVLHYTKTGSKSRF